MSKAILMSIRPEWCAMILSGRKTAEVRKSYPKAKDLPYPFKVYIYRTQMPGQLIDIMKEGDKIDYYLPEGEEPTIYHGKPTFIKTLPEKGLVIGEFVCDSIESLTDHLPNAAHGYHQPLHGCTCLTGNELEAYGLSANKGYRELYSWHISSLKVRPLELSAFGMKRPPQSWCYVEELPE